MSFRPLNSGNSLSSNLSQVNDMVRQLNKEQVTKTFRQANGNAIITGKLPYDGGYGSLYYDSTGTARILIGIAPDGEIDIAASDSGYDITGLYS
jgi:hypothetical protein